MSTSTAERINPGANKPPSTDREAVLGGDSMHWYPPVQEFFDTLREIVQRHNKRPTSPAEQPPTDLIPLASALSIVYKHNCSPTEYGDWHTLNDAAGIIEAHGYLTEAKLVRDNIGARPEVQFSATGIDPDFPTPLPNPDEETPSSDLNNTISLGKTAVWPTLL